VRASRPYLERMEELEDMDAFDRAMDSQEEGLPAATCTSRALGPVTK